MSILHKVEQPTAPETAYQWLLDAITSLPWDEEAFISENSVAEATGTSRTPVREALLKLESEGLLRRVPRRGALVPALSTQDITAMIEARCTIEEWAVRKLTRAGHPIDTLEKLLAKQTEIISDAVVFIHCDVAFHKDIVRSANNSVFEEVYSMLRHKQLRMGVRAVRDSNGRSDHVVAEHRAIVEGISSGDPQKAATAVTAHLSSTLSALLDTPHK